MELGVKLGEKDGSARGGGDSESGGNSNRGTSKDPGVEESKTFDPREMHRHQQGRSRMGALQPMGPRGKSAGSLVMV